MLESEIRVFLKLLISAINFLFFLVPENLHYCYYNFKKGQCTYCTMDTWTVNDLCLKTSWRCYYNFLNWPTFDDVRWWLSFKTSIIVVAKWIISCGAERQHCSFYSRPPTLSNSKCNTRKNVWLLNTICQILQIIQSFRWEGFFKVNLLHGFHSKPAHDVVLMFTHDFTLFLLQTTL